MWSSKFLLTILLTTPAASAAPYLDAIETNSFQARRVKLIAREDINFDNFPECAKPHCNSSSSLSPSRIGCVETILTKDCLCTVAVTPLSCVPSGPSSEENCWYDVEDWFAGQCDRNVALVPTASMPSCMADCTMTWLHTKGCRTDTRNCFCKLDGNEIVNAAEKCRRSGCMKHMQPGFNVPFWREQMCSQRRLNNYDEGAYQKRKKMVKNVRIVVPVFLGVFVLLPLVVGGAIVCSEDGEEGKGFALILGAVCIALLVLVPIYVAI